MTTAIHHRRPAKPSTAPLTLTDPGDFVIGCNYWASHAGTHMWSDWRPTIVASDLRKLAAAKLQVLRVFPLWSDFQPIHLLRGYLGRPVEMCMGRGESPLPDDARGQAGMDGAMMERFQVFLDLANKNGLRCIVGLITGWMSGRLFVPPALEGLNPLTDPRAMRWELRLVKQLVTAFKGHPAVLAWDLGNECNCMGEATQDQAYTWTAAIAAAIRAADPSRPIVSGMHSLKPDGAWTPRDQAELTDVLTTHPYPLFTPHSGKDPLHSLRSILHSTAESRYYADLGGRPCLCEEIGTLGPMLGSDNVVADYMRACLWSLWANGCQGALWWCGFDQAHLEHPPYDWLCCERELGLVKANGRPKPVLKEFTQFRAALERLPFRKLPPRRREAVCILSQGQDTWAAAYSSFILAKQAGFDVEFQYAEQAIRKADLYLLPSTRGMNIIPRRRWRELLDNVAAGATLYTSVDDGIMDGFADWSGLRVVTRAQRPAAGAPRTQGENVPALHVYGSWKLRLETAGAEVLMREPDGNPLFTLYRLGRGRVFFLGMPLETELARQPGAFLSSEAHVEIYRRSADRVLTGRAIRKDHPLLALTEHPVNKNERLVVAISLSSKPLSDNLRISSGWRLGKVWQGLLRRTDAGQHLTLPACSAAVFQLTRRGGERK